MERELKQPFTNAQLELLKIFSIQLDDDEMKELKQLMGKFYLNRLTKRTNQVWDEKGWTEKTMEEFLNTTLRKKSV